MNENQFTENAPVPPPEGKDARDAFERLYQVIKTLRSPCGCPWDREQTPITMRGDLVEETFEAVDAITQDDSAHAMEELGDVFLNTAMIAYMYEQRGDFSVADVLNDVAEKIVRRHPHVWKDSEGAANANETKAKTAEEVLTQWDNIKRGVEGRAAQCVLDEVSEGLPPLLRSYKIQKKASKKGFDWDNVESVFDKVQEEILEIREAKLNFENAPETEIEKFQSELEGEVGDLLFAVVNLSRHLRVNPTLALSRTNKKFRDRFAYVEQKMNESNLPMKIENIETMEKFWNEAKKIMLKEISKL